MRVAQGVAWRHSDLRGGFTQREIRLEMMAAIRWAVPQKGLLVAFTQRNALALVPTPEAALCWFEWGLSASADAQWAAGDGPEPCSHSFPGSDCGHSPRCPVPAGGDGLCQAARLLPASMHEKELLFSPSNCGGFSKTKSLIRSYLYPKHMYVHATQPVAFRSAPTHRLLGACPIAPSPCTDVPLPLSPLGEQLS